MQTWIITGVSRGIGKALAIHFLGEGCRVIGTSTSGVVDYQHPNLEVAALNLSESESIHALVSMVEASGYAIDGLINNAAVLVESRSENRIDMQRVRQTFETNVFGSMTLTEALMPSLTPEACIINISSKSGTFSEPNFSMDAPAYRLSKCALNFYTKLLAVNSDNAQRFVAAVHPGWVKTDMGSDAAPGCPKAVAQTVWELTVNRGDSGQLWFNGQVKSW